MHSFVRNLLAEWRKLNLPFDDETFVIAVSGGADSVSLAIALDDLKKRKKLKLRFVLAHFNHDLRGEESEKDADFVKDIAQRNNLELALVKGEISKEGNLEQNARISRYTFLMETAENLNAYGILTAHTINDQAETFLLNLIRGSGMAGLSGMKPVITNYKLQITNSEKGFQTTNSEQKLQVSNLKKKSQIKNLEKELQITSSEKKSEIRNPKPEIALVRPLLNWATRKDTENFCHFNEIEYRIDSMNEDLNFKRVRIRKILLPVLKDFNPKILETLAKTANLLRIENEEIQESKDQVIKTGNECLSLKDLKKLSKSAIYRVLRDWLEANRGNLRQLELKHIGAIERLILSRKSGRVVELPNGEKVVKEKGLLILIPNKPN